MDVITTPAPTVAGSAEPSVESASAPSSNRGAAAKARDAGTLVSVDPGERRRRSLVEKVRGEVMDAPPTMKDLRSANSGGALQKDAAATFGSSKGGCARQVYDPQIDRQQTELIAQLTQRLDRTQLQHKQITASEALASNQAVMLQMSLQMLIDDNDIGPSTMEERQEHDELTARLSGQLAELEDTVARHRASKNRLEAAVALAENELKQRRVVRLRVTADVERTLAGLIEAHGDSKQ
eukprot:SAG11_NODE_1014_length_6184_cov_2.581265_5_plen_238_part_00